MPTFTVAATGERPDLIPGLLARVGIASRGQFGGEWRAVIHADSARTARQRVADALAGTGFAPSSADAAR